MDEVECWKIRLALVDAKPERLLDTLHATNRDLYPAIYSIICILLTMPVSSATSERSFSAIRRVNPSSGRLLAMNDCPTYHLCIYTDMCKSTWI